MGKKGIWMLWFPHCFALYGIDAKPNLHLHVRVMMGGKTPALFREATLPSCLKMSRQPVPSTHQAPSTGSFSIAQAGTCKTPKPCTCFTCCHALHERAAPSPMSAPCIALRKPERLLRPD